ncbi:unnamed protein product (mitochondrion) [Plasmodiophora brassicae]|uniref:SAM-dependent MTase RsmB/NOP-type domain-containing protein n=1 Tax=Plasmodiophora brassicae TaxID=37360 RepID=A0A0G4J5V2_PLABS|nr:hypothetical protein PBRA_002598 [Plasmodiophora brassicae]SPQ94759.1 unnamed protein product [Plasmodiophora brassicae]
MRGKQAFVQYYSAQRIVDEEQWGDFTDALERPLPITFTVTRQFAGGLGLHLQDRLRDGAFPEVHCLDWYPDGSAWKVVTRREEWSPEFKGFLLAATESGLIVRQELVSMIPALMLCEPTGDGAIQSILDMCAAPGSKTSQLLQLVRERTTGLPFADDGVVVANDIDANRCQLTLNRLKCTGSSALVMTRCDATCFPTNTLFDRVLCDAPCTGDGTIRKSPKMMSRWKSTSGTNLHCLQIKIAARAFQLTKPGGRMVYSTCSLNPVENEAVVQYLLREFGSAIELVDMSKALNGLHRSPGLSSWEVMAATKSCTKLSSFKDVQSAKDAGFGGNCPSSVFPLHDSSLELSRAMRFVPHLNDSGGFFVAVFQRVPTCSPLADAPVMTSTIRGSNDCTFTPLLEVDGGREMAETLRSSMSLADTFPMNLLHVLKRDDGGESGRRSKVYMLSPQALEKTRFHTETEGLMHSGVRVFERTCRKDSSLDDFRICWEGLPHVLPHMNPDERIRLIPPSTFRALLHSLAVPIDSLSGLRDALDGALLGNIVLQSEFRGHRVSVAARYGRVSVQVQNRGALFRYLARILD